MMFLRLRQLCLVAVDLQKVVGDLCAVFGVPVCHRDPAVGQFGLENALVALGTNFVEVVAPLHDNTAAGRYLQRRGGDSGYMVIFDTDDIEYWRAHVAHIDVRLAANLEHDAYTGLQLHPRDTGGALLEINTTRGNSNDPRGPYAPAGARWQQALHTERALAIRGAVLQGDDPERLARRWGEILRQPVHAGGEAWTLPVDNAVLNFVPASDGRGEGLHGIDLEAADAAAIISVAKARGCPADARSVLIGGVRFYLRESQA